MMDARQDGVPTSPRQLHLRARILICFGAFILLFVVPGLLVFSGYLWMVINAGEHGMLARTGSSTSAMAFPWEPWQPGKGEVYVFRDLYDNNQRAVIVKLRTKRAHGWLFDFTWHEGMTADVPPKVYAVIGPGWGASYHYSWCVLAGAVGVGCLVGGRRLEKRVAAPPAA